MKTVKQTFSENSLILIISTIIIKIIGAIFKIPLASDMFLGDLGFGYYSVAHDIFMPFYVLAISGLPSAVSHITAELIAKNNNDAIFSNFKKSKKLFIISGIIFSVATVIISIPIVLSQETSKNTLYSIFAILPSIFLCFVISAYRGYFEGHNNMYPTAVSKIVEAVFKLVLGLLLSYFVIKTTNNPALASAAALLAVSVGTLFATLYLSVKYKRQNNNNFTLNTNSDKVNIKILFSLTLPYVLASLSASIISIIDIFTVKTYIANASQEYLQMLNVNSIDVSTYLYGIRSKAFTLFYLVPTITMSLGVSAVPIISKARAEGDSANLKNSCEFSLKIISFITFPAAIGLTVLSKPIMNLLYSSCDVYSVNLMALYGIAALFAGFSVPLTSIIQALNLQKKAIVTIIVGITIKIAVNLLAVTFPNVNIFAAPLGTIICYLFLTVVMLVFLKKAVGKFSFFSTVLKPFFAALVCGGCALFISNNFESKISTVISIFVAFIVYILVNFAIKTFEKSEVLTLPIINKIIK